MLKLKLQPDVKRCLIEKVNLSLMLRKTEVKGKGEVEDEMVR